MLASLDQSASWADQPSGLPGWSRRHVAAHLLGNAEGMLNLVQWASTGVRTPMYASPEVRKADIEERAQWPFEKIRDTLADLSTQLAVGCDGLVEPLAEHDLVLGSGAAIEAWEIPMMRTREVEIHHVDLAADYSPDDWTPTFSLRTMNQVVGAFAARGGLPVAELRANDTGRVWSFDNSSAPSAWLEGAECQLLAWLIGRPHTSISYRAAPGQSPATPPPAPVWV